MCISDMHRVCVCVYIYVCLSVLHCVCVYQTCIVYVCVYIYMCLSILHTFFIHSSVSGHLGFHALLRYVPSLIHFKWMLNFIKCFFCIY